MTDIEYILNYYNEILIDNRFSVKDRIAVGNLLIYEMNSPDLSQYETIKEWSLAHIKWKREYPKLSNQANKIITRSIVPIRICASHINKEKDPLKIKESIIQKMKVSARKYNVML